MPITAVTQYQPNQRNRIGWHRVAAERYKKFAIYDKYFVSFY